MLPLLKVSYILYQAIKTAMLINDVTFSERYSLKKKFKRRTEKNSILLRGSLNKFPDFFRKGTFIDSTHMKLYSPSK